VTGLAPCGVFCPPRLWTFSILRDLKPVGVCKNLCKKDGGYADLQKMLSERIARSKAAQDSLPNTVLGKEIIKELPDATMGDGHSLQSGQSVKNGKNSFSS